MFCANNSRRWALNQKGMKFDTSAEQNEETNKGFFPKKFLTRQKFGLQTLKINFWPTRSWAD